MPVRVAGKAILDLGYLHSKVNIEDLFAGDNPKIHTELERTLSASEHHLNDSDTVIFSTATLKRILVIFQTSKKVLPSRFWNEIILHIRRVWDYSADCVCYDAVETFALLLSIHLEQCIDCIERPDTDSHANCDWINEITQWLLEPTSLCRSRFRCISHLVVQCPTLRLNLGEDFFHRIYELIANPTFSTVACQLIVDNIYDREELWDLHCDMLLLRLTATHDVKLIKTRLIPMLQKYHPTSMVEPAGKKKGRGVRNEKSETALKFLNQLTTQLNATNPPIDLQSHMEIIHALVTTTWPRKKSTDDQLLQLVDFSHWSQCVSEQSMSTAIFHVDSEVRLSAFKLLVENPRKNLIFNETDLEYIKVFLDSNMTLQAPSQRHSLIASYKMMCQRIGSSAESYLKQTAPSDRDSDSFSPESSTFEDDRMRCYVRKDEYIHPIPEAYIALVKWMAKLAFEGLSKNGNFYRRIMALMQIDVLFSKENFVLDRKNLFVERLDLDRTLGSDRHQLVLNCLDDSYEIVQSTALALLQRLDFGNVNLKEEEYFREVIGLMNSTRSRNSLAAGYRLRYYLHRHPERFTVFVKRFIEDVKVNIDMAEKELMNITTHPFHPMLNMLELLLRNPTWIEEQEPQLKSEFYKEVLKELIPLCHRIASIVTPVVHNMSPEGCIPDDALEKLYGKSTNDLAEISQHLLVCCWRAHKHVSGIFAYIIEKHAPENLVTKAEIEEIGSFYWTQLTECKHRGAFETATEGFAQLCQFLWTTSIPDLPKPATWLDEILAAIRGEADLTNLCSTRRSAGLPHLVLAIVSTEPKEKENEALIRAAESLLNMEGKAVEYRVHSMNVMKTIIQNATLHERAAFCYEKTLRVAIDACRADWSERNAASQLFAALRTKIFGVMRSAQRSLNVDQKNRKSNYEFFSKFPSLYNFLFHQLKIEQSEFSLIPPLVLLTHLYTPESSAELFPLRPFIPPLLELALHEKRENIRAHAVAAILSVSDIYAKSDLCNWVESFDTGNSRQNHIHSYLMLVEGLLNCIQFMERMRNLVRKLMDTNAYKHWSDFNINQLLTMVNFCGGIDYDSYDVPLQSICLAKRPLVQKMLLSRDVFMTELSFMWKDADSRMEVYRTICKRGWENTCNQYLRAHVLSKAVSDLENIENIPQCDARNILRVLSTSDCISAELAQKLTTLIYKCLDNPNLNWTLPSTMAYAMKLKYTYCGAGDPFMIQWIEQCYELDDPETKEVAIDVGGTFVLQLELKTAYTPFEKSLIRAVALYLQDESENLRQRTAFYLNRLIKHSHSTAINPAICRLLVIKWCLNDGQEDPSKYHFYTGAEKRVEERDDLFDACAVNQYAEYALFGNIQMAETSLGVSESNAEMYDIEY